MRVVLVSNTAAYLRHMWLPLARALRDRGLDVLLAAPPDECVHDLIQEGFAYRHISLPRGPSWPWREIQCWLELVRLYRRERPTAVHHFTLRPVVYGSLAAKVARVPVGISTISGLGYVFSRRGVAAAAAQYVLLRLCRFALRSTNSCVIFQNPDDRDLFVRQCIVPPERAAVVRSSGVDTRALGRAPMPVGLPVVLCAARLLWEKGIGDFVAAARLVKNHGIPARFVLAGWRDEDHPRSISEEVLRGWEEQGLVQYLGYRKDMPNILRQATVVVLPSLYREGVPRILVEAAAVGRPLVATDVPGCREICINGVTGILVKPGDVQGLARAIADILTNPVKAATFGDNARQLAEREFDVSQVVERTLSIYEALGILNSRCSARSAHGSMAQPKGNREL